MISIYEALFHYKDDTIIRKVYQFDIKRINKKQLMISIMEGNIINKIWSYRTFFRW